jgi:exodeoxyribonuclease VII small subunit
MSEQRDEQGDSAPAISYEAAREELIEVVRRLESGGSNLEESLALWERGEKLAQVCQSWLDGAKQRLEAAISKDAPQG